MSKLNKAFTLIELLVTISILSVLMLVTVFSYSNFNDRLSLSSAVQELAISIRQAQSYGLNVKERGVGSGLFDSAYGIYFDLDDLTRYTVFVDTNGNRVYDEGNGCGSASTECIQESVLRDGVLISQICDGLNNCPPAAGFSVRNLNVTFLRPNPDARIYFANNGGSIMASSNTGKVVLISKKGITSGVTIENTGQVYAQ